MIASKNSECNYKWCEHRFSISCLRFWRWKHHDPIKHCSTCTKLHSIITQKGMIEIQLILCILIFARICIQWWYVDQRKLHMKMGCFSLISNCRLIIPRLHHCVTTSVTAVTAWTQICMKMAKCVWVFLVHGVGKGQKCGPSTLIYFKSLCQFKVSSQVLPNWVSLCVHKRGSWDWQGHLWPESKGRAYYLRGK